jgi:class 3 adenylate cyclase/uncharacterized protein YdcH (DUF465 family)
MEQKDYRLAAVMFTDIVGFSRMMEEDEVGTLQTLDFHDKLVREEITKARGSVIKTIGDAFLAQFQTALDAVKCSIAIQDGLREYNRARLGKEIRLRIGVHLGDIYFYENDALGEGINIASRLQSITEPGHITISREVYSQVSGKVPMKVEARGQVQLKNITREVHAYEIIPGGEDNDSSAYRRAQREKGQPATEAPKPEPAEAPSRPAPSPTFQGARDDWRTLRDRIKDEVRSEGGRWKDVKRQLKTEFRAEFRGGLRSAEPDAAPTLADGTPASAYQVYREKKIRQAERSRGGFWGHLGPFVVVNGVLAAVNLNQPGAAPWFLIPLLGWGIGLVSHAVSGWAAQRTAREVTRIADASDEDFDVIKKYQDARSGLYSHLGSNLMVAALLEGIAYVVDNGHWGQLSLIMLIPIAAMALGVFGHLSSFFARRPGFRQVWKALKGGRHGGSKPSLGSGPKASSKTVVGPDVEDADPVVRKARALRDSILVQAAGMKGGNPFGEDISTTLDNYVVQIAELSAIERDLGQVVASLRPGDLAAEAGVLQAKIGATTSNALKQEYEKSLASLEKQRTSFDDLAEQQEILNLRIKGAVGSLQQMQVDLARIKGLADGQRDPSFVPIKEKSEELSRYIEDYREGLKEIPD